MVRLNNRHSTAELGSVNVALPDRRPGSDPFGDGSLWIRDPVTPGTDVQRRIDARDRKGEDLLRGDDSGPAVRDDRRGIRILGTQLVGAA